MSKTVRIFNSDGDHVHDYVVNVGAINYNIKEDEFFDEAWQCAVDDELVNPEDRASYKFVFV